MVKHTLFAVTIGLLIFFLYLLQYTGAFKTVPVAVDDRGPYTMVAISHTGAYHKIVEKIEGVEKWAKQNGLSCRLSFGEYIDNPRLSEEGRLRSFGGCLVDPLDAKEASVLEQLKSKLPEGYEIRQFPKSKVVVALFSGAPSIGPMKVYPKAEEFMQNGSLNPTGTVLEIYEIHSQKSVTTTYLWPLRSQ